MKSLPKIQHLGFFISQFDTKRLNRIIIYYTEVLYSRKLENGDLMVTYIKI